MRRVLWLLTLSTAMAACTHHQRVNHQPLRQVVQGDAFGFVTQKLGTPLSTRVFAKGQYGTRDLPFSVWIGNAVYVSMSGSESLTELARAEGQRLNADYVVVGANGNGLASSIALLAYRVLPSSLDYGQEKGVVTYVAKPSALSLRVGDRLSTIQGVPFDDRMPELFRIKPGDTVTFTVLRDDKPIDIRLKAGPNPTTHLQLQEARLD